MSKSLVQFVETWQASIAEVMTQIAARPVTVSWELVAADALPVVGNDDLWVRFDAPSFGVGAELAFHIRAADALTLAQVFMGEKIDPGASLSEDSREAVAEASRQIAGRAATELKRKFADCELTYLQHPVPPWKAESAATFRLKTDNWNLEADVFLNAGLSQSLVKPEDYPRSETATKTETPPSNVADKPKQVPAEEVLKAAPPATPEAPPIPVAPPVRQPPVTRRVKRNNLDLLLDVNLAVTLRFGQRQMTLRDILQLRSGSVIELDRQTDEPVDLLLDDRVIARGEVVVVDGNYGLRVLEICAQSDRVALLT